MRVSKLAWLLLQVELLKPDKGQEEPPVSRAPVDGATRSGDDSTDSRLAARHCLPCRAAAAS